MLRMRNSTLKTILAAATQLCLLWQVLGCGQVQTMGGIVDNGDKPEEPSPGTPADNSQGPISDPSSIIAATELFSSRYRVGLPKGFSRQVATDDQEVFVRNEVESIVFIIGRPLDCGDSSPALNANGIKVHPCNNGIILFESRGTEFVTMRHSLEALEWQPVVDSFKAL